MHEQTALGMLSRVMGWDLERSQEEFQWLRLVSAVKYDSYRDFLAGMRFLESLVGWLLQFKEQDREAAYAFVRHRLTFISAVERERLVEIMYPRTVLPKLLKDVATVACDGGVPVHFEWGVDVAIRGYDCRRAFTHARILWRPAGLLAQLDIRVFVK